MQKLQVCGLVLLAVGVGAGVFYVTSYSKDAGSAVAQTDPATPGACAAHGVPEAECPWCEPSLIEALGHCGGHGVPEALCSRCNAALIPGFKAVGDWCAGHDLPESQCVACNGPLPPGEHNAGPEGAFCNRHQLAEADCPWCTPSLIEALGHCGGHGVPEALCSRCNASLIPGFKAERDWCAPHAVPESQCLVCHPSLRAKDAAPSSGPLSEVPRIHRAPSTRCATTSLRVRFASPEVAADAGFEYATVGERAVPAALSCTAEVEHNRNRFAHVAPRAPGVLGAVSKDLGDPVRAGEPLATVISSELGAAKADLLQAGALLALWERTHAREQELLAGEVSTLRDALKVETELAKSRVDLARATHRLRSLGLSEAGIAQVASANDVSAELGVKAPFAGTVVERHAVVGEVVDTHEPLFAVADTSTVWAMLDVQEADVRRLQVGQPLVLTVTGLRGEQFAGRVTWISPELNRRTRTLRARAEVHNPSGVLRAGMFGQAVVQLSGPAPRVLVPKAAVQWEGCCNVVFVRTSEVLFEPRKVRLGSEAGAFWVVEVGLRAGDVVVTTGSFLLKTEILKGSIGAGCCEVEPPR